MAFEKRTRRIGEYPPPYYTHEELNQRESKDLSTLSIAITVFSIVIVGCYFYFNQ